MNYFITATFQDSNMPPVHVENNDKEGARMSALSLSRRYAGLRAITILDKTTGDKAVYNGNCDYLWTLPGTAFKEKA